MPAYYNEIDPYAAQWLKNLIAAGHIASGDVDERSIVDVRADDLRGYGQCHFFAGIGGWSLALRIAGWSDDRPVWTGSCPCQPFSSAGRGKAGDDERHLWPSWFSLIAECGPAIVFGEQVEAAIGWGWLDAVFADLETAGYACGATVLPACGVGAPHIRQRLWFVADSGGERLDRQRLRLQSKASGRHQADILEAAGGGEACELADAARTGEWRYGRQSRSKTGEGQGEARPKDGNSVGGPSGMGHASGREIAQRARSPWAEAEWIACRDGRSRAIEPGTFPLATGISNRVGRLRAYGNAIVPQVSAEFVATFMEHRP